MPLAALFAVYLFTSNLVYSYLGVGFIQMLKPANGIMLFALTLSIGLEGRPELNSCRGVVRKYETGRGRCAAQFGAIL